MKTHRMYRQQREETPNILVLHLHPGENDVPVEMFEALRRGRVTLMFDQFKLPEQLMGVHTMNPMCTLEVSHD